MHWLVPPHRIAKQTAIFQWKSIFFRGNSPLSLHFQGKTQKTVSVHNSQYNPEEVRALLADEMRPTVELWCDGTKAIDLVDAARNDDGRHATKLYTHGHLPLLALDCDRLSFFFRLCRGDKCEAMERTIVCGSRGRFVHMYLKLQSKWPFFNTKSSFLGATLHHLCIFNRTFKRRWHLYCNSYPSMR